MLPIVEMKDTIQRQPRFKLKIECSIQLLVWRRFRWRRPFRNKFKKIQWNHLLRIHELDWVLQLMVTIRVGSSGRGFFAIAHFSDFSPLYVHTSTESTCNASSDERKIINHTLHRWTKFSKTFLLPVLLIGFILLTSKWSQHCFKQFC